MTKPAAAGTLRTLDRSVVEQVRARSPRALNVFFEHYFERVYAYAVRLLRDTELAADVVQEAFLRMHKAIETLDPERDPSAWVFTIVTNTARDHWRSRAHRAARRSVDLEDAWDVVADDPESDPERGVQRREQRERLDAAMRRLSAADREVLLLREFEGMSNGEIASLLQLSAEAVRQRYSRAVRRLAEAYGVVEKGNSA